MSEALPEARLRLSLLLTAGLTLLAGCATRSPARPPQRPEPAPEPPAAPAPAAPALPPPPSPSPPPIPAPAPARPEPRPVPSASPSTFERQTANRAQALRRFPVGQEARVELSASTLRPAVASPGGVVVAELAYTVLLPAAAGQVALSLQRQLRIGSETLPLSRKQVLRPQGSHLSHLRLTLPADLPPGTYTLVTTLHAAGQQRSIEATLTVR